MDKHDYTEIYEIGGSLIQKEIEKLIQDETTELINYIHPDRIAQIKSCAQYLKDLSDDKFREIYLDMSMSMGDFEDNLEEHLEMHLGEFCHLDYAFAYVSDILILQKCLAISMKGYL
jgi:hypothetical protein